MVEINVTETPISLEVAGNINVALSTENVLVAVEAGQVIPAVEITAGIQGPEGIKGDTGDKGDKGDALVYNLLTPEEKSEVIAQFDNAIGSTSYANIFLNAYLS